ncbi:MAG: hypothetical protein ACR2J0_04000 [Mycobacteriales bacterium]
MRLPLTRRPTAVLLATACAAALAACSSDKAPGPGEGGGGGAAEGSAPASPTVPASASPAPLAQLPVGGRTIFPRYRVVCYYGGAAGGALGVLGEGTPAQAGQRLLKAAAPFKTATRPVLPAFELITTVAQAHAGDDGDYSEPTAAADVQRYLTEVRKIKGLLILDLQPGRSDFLSQARLYEKFLEQPDVGLALDSEWHMKPGQVPGKVIGSASAAEINSVSAYLSGIVARKKLPQKLFVIHQFTLAMVQNKPQITSPPGLAVVFHIDGFGSRAAKLQKYAVLHVKPPFYNGLKLFYDEDIKRFSPKEAVALTPSPDLFSYQ